MSLHYLNNAKLWPLSRDMTKDVMGRHLRAGVTCAVSYSRIAREQVTATESGDLSCGGLFFCALCVDQS